MKVFIIGPGGPDIAALKKENEAEQQVLEFIHLVRSQGMPIALVLMYSDLPGQPVMDDYEVAFNMAHTAAQIRNLVGRGPTILPILGRIPNGEQFAGRKYALKVVLLDEVLQELQQQKEAAAASQQAPPG